MCFTISVLYRISTHRILFSKSRNKRLQCCDWWKELFWSASKKWQKKNENIRKIDTGHGDDYTTSFLLDYLYFKENHKVFGIDLSKQQALDADPKEIQQINFTGNLEQAGNKTIFFTIEEEKATNLGTLIVL